MIAKNISNENKLKFLIIFFVSLIVFVSIAIKIFVSEEKKYADKIYPHVYIDTTNVGQKSKKEALELFNKQDNDLKSVQIEVDYKDTPIATFSASQIHLKFDTPAIIDRAFLIGRSTHFLSKIIQQVQTLSNLKSFYFERNIEYDKSVFKDFINSISDQYSYPAKNALFSFNNGRVTDFRKEEAGLQIQNQEFIDQIDKMILALKTNQKNIIIDIKTKIIDPEISLAKANSYGIEELIATGKSNYTHSIPERIHNLSLAATKFNGVLIPKGKIFSFNDAVGDISSLTGYKPAYIIKSGKTVLGDGGGVCQVSTTLFRTALNAGLPIIERVAHAYRVGYYENDSSPGFDATVFAPSADLKILNDTPTSILIETENDKNNNILIFKFYGKKDGRKIEISPATVYDIQPAPPSLFQDDPTLKKGVQKQIDFAASGAKVIFSYKVTYPDGQVKDNKFFSNFKPWQAVYLNGTAD